MRYRFLPKKAGKLLAAVMIVGLFTVGMVGCYKEPSFPVEPSIEFADITKAIRIDQFTGANKDSVVLSIKFRDGDGNLGFSEQEKADAQLAEKYNYVVKPFRQRRGRMEEYTPFIPYSGFFSRLKNDDKIGPIEGTLDYSIDFPHPFTPKRDSVQFQIYIVDREGNRSNTVQTETIVLNEF